MPEASIVGLPYQMLLHERTRQSLGIDLAGQVVIIDEAHNVVDAISDLYNVSVTLQEVCRGTPTNDRARGATCGRTTDLPTWARAGWDGLVLYFARF